MNTSFENFNLHIETASAEDTFLATVQDDKGSVLATNEFKHTIDPLILSRLESSVGINIPANAELIKTFGSGLFNTVFSDEDYSLY